MPRPSAVWRSLRPSDGPARRAAPAAALHRRRGLEAGRRLLLAVEVELDGGAVGILAEQLPLRAAGLAAQVVLDAPPFQLGGGPRQILCGDGHVVEPAGRGGGGAGA